MTIELRTVDVDQLPSIVEELSRWQREEAPIQLHPGDLGWNWRSGAATLAPLLRTWEQDGTVVALAYLDSPDVVRMTVSPERWLDDDLAARVVDDLSSPARGLLPAGAVAVEVPDGTAVKARLTGGEWADGDAWAPLRCDLSHPVPTPLPTVEVVRSDAQVAECVAVHRSAWERSRFTAEQWHEMAAGPAFGDARCLLLRDDSGVAVATLTAWPAGQGRPGLVEPLGVHTDHRRRGHGVAICRAAAAHLQQLGASSVRVCTPSSLHSAVATYVAAGFERLPDRLDRARDA